MHDEAARIGSDGIRHVLGDRDANADRNDSGLSRAEKAAEKHLAKKRSAAAAAERRRLKELGYDDEQISKAAMTRDPELGDAGAEMAGRAAVAATQPGRDSRYSVTPESDDWRNDTGSGLQSTHGHGSEAEMGDLSRAKRWAEEKEKNRALEVEALKANACEGDRRHG